MVQDEAWFLDIGNSSPSCTMWEWGYPGEDFSSPGESDRSPPSVAADTASSVGVPIQKSCVIQARG